MVVVENKNGASQLDAAVSGVRDTLIQQALSYALEELVSERPGNPIEYTAKKLLEFQSLRDAEGGVGAGVGGVGGQGAAPADTTHGVKKGVVAGGTMGSGGAGAVKNAAGGGRAVGGGAHHHGRGVAPKLGRHGSSGLGGGPSASSSVPSRRSAMLDDTPADSLSDSDGDSGAGDTEDESDPPMSSEDEEGEDSDGQSRGSGADEEEDEDGEGSSGTEGGRGRGSRSHSRNRSSGRGSSRRGSGGGSGSDSGGSDAGGGSRMSRPAPLHPGLRGGGGGGGGVGIGGGGSSSPRVSAMPAHMARYNRARRTSVSAETFQKRFVYPDEIKAKLVPGSDGAALVKTPEQAERTRKAVSRNFMFRSLDASQLDEVVAAMFESRRVRGDVVIRQGDEGDNFYVIDAGECEVFVSKERAAPKLVKKLGPGESFGELALMYFCPRAATVRCSTDCVLWAVDRQVFRRIVMESTLRKRRLYESFLANVSILGALNDYERSKLADALESVSFDDDEVIIRQGDRGDSFYIVEEGHAVAIMDVKDSNSNGNSNNASSGTSSRDGGGGANASSPSPTAGGTATTTTTSSVVVREDYVPGDYFGELALLTDQPRACSVIAKGPVKLLSLDRHAFSRLLGSVESSLRRNVDLYQNYAAAIADRHAQIRETKKLKEKFGGNNK